MKDVPGRAACAVCAAAFATASCGGIDVSRSLEIRGDVRGVPTDLGSPESLVARWPEKLDGDAGARREFTRIHVANSGEFRIRSGHLEGEFWILLPNILPLAWARSSLSPAWVSLEATPGEAGDPRVMLLIEPDEAGGFVVRRTDADEAPGTGPVVGRLEPVSLGYAETVYEVRWRTDDDSRRDGPGDDPR